MNGEVAMSFLSKLKIVHNTMLNPDDPIHKRRIRLIERLKEQQEMAHAMLNKKPYTKMKKVWVPDAETGGEVRKLMPVPVRSWYWQFDGIYYFQVFYGRRKIPLRNGKSAVVVGNADQLPEVIGTIICAVESGELDKALKSAYIRKPVE